VTSEDEIPFQTSNAVQGAVASDVEYTTAGITLNITPSISAQKYLRLSIKLTVSSFRGEATGTLPPAKATRTIQTNVNLPDGATMWLGGIIRDDETTSESGIPYLSDIPLIGGLFGRNTKNNVKTTLFFFCTPKILEDFNELDDISRDGKSRAAATIGLNRVRMIDQDYQYDSPVDVILETDNDHDGSPDSGSLNLSGFAAPRYQGSGGVMADGSSISSNRILPLQDNQ